MAVNRVSLTINSRKYTVVANESEQYIEKLGNHVNEKVEYVRKGGQNVLGERPVVLAALNICDEYFKALEAGELIKDQMQKCTEKNTQLQNELKRYKSDSDDLGDQVSIEETALRAEVKSAKDELYEANNKIKFLEGHVKGLENKLKDLDEKYKQQKVEYLKKG